MILSKIPDGCKLTTENRDYLKNIECINDSISLVKSSGQYIDRAGCLRYVYRIEACPPRELCDLPALAITAEAGTERRAEREARAAGDPAAALRGLIELAVADGCIDFYSPRPAWLVILSEYAEHLTPERLASLYELVNTRTARNVRADLRRKPATPSPETKPSTPAGAADLTPST